MTDKDTAPVTEAEDAPHVSDRIPVETRSPEPLESSRAAPEAAEPEAQQDAEADGAPADKAEGEKKVAKVQLPEWAQKKISQAEFERREAARKAKELEAELAELRKQAQTKGNAATTDADVQAASDNAPTGGYRSQADFDAAVQAEANRRAQDIAARQAQADFDAKCNTTYEKGTAEYGENFATAVQNLQQVGVMTPDMLNMVLEADAPEAVLFALGEDPDKAAQIMAMTPAKRAIAIAKLDVQAATPQKKAPEPISNAPRPVTPVSGTARPSGNPRDDDDDATWFRKRNAEIAARMQRSA